MLQGASIVCLSSIDWSFNRQNPQEVALALAERGNRVLFIENTGVRTRNPPRREAAVVAFSSLVAARAAA